MASSACVQMLALSSFSSSSLLSSTHSASLVPKITPRALSFAGVISARTYFAPSLLLAVFPTSRTFGLHSQVFSLHCTVHTHGSRSLVPYQRCAMSASPASSAAAVPCPPEGYRANVGVCLVNNSGKVFIASRIDAPGAWQMPQGGIDVGEDARVAAARELREETGVTSAEYLAETSEWLTYDFPPQVRARLAKQWGTDWNGQAQRWFLFRFKGEESEISLDGDGVEPPEFSEWKWADVADVISGAVPFKRHVYEAAFKSFMPILQKLDS